VTRREQPWGAGGYGCIRCQARGIRSMFPMRSGGKKGWMGGGGGGEAGGSPEGIPEAGEKGGTRNDRMGKRNRRGGGAVGRNRRDGICLSGLWSGKMTYCGL
jgi:hypothetical protein